MLPKSGGELGHGCTNRFGWIIGFACSTDKTATNNDSVSTSIGRPRRLFWCGNTETDCHWNRGGSLGPCDNTLNSWRDPVTLAGRASYRDCVEKSTSPLANIRKS
jgi:hypothetical protein